MANEAQINVSLRIQNGNFGYQSSSGAYTANVAGTFGPTPGAVTVSVSGTSISLAGLSAMGGLIILKNYDPTKSVRWGIEDSVTNHFIPIGRLLPGETQIFRLDNSFGEYEATAGTGTFTGSTVSLYMKAQGGNCVVFVGAFNP